MWPLYRREQEAEVERAKLTARLVGLEVARILAPLWGGKVEDTDTAGESSFFTPEAEAYLERTSGDLGDV